MIPDEEAEDIRKKLEEGWRGPVLLRWLRDLLNDREERVQQQRETERTEGRPPDDKPALRTS